MIKEKIGSVEAIMLILTVVVSHSFLAFPNEVLTNYTSASGLNILYVSIIAILVTLLIVELFKNFPSMDILDVSEFIGGTFFKNFIGTLFVIYFIVTSSIMLRNFCESLKIIYYQLTKPAFLISIFVIAICIANNFSFNATIKTNKLILPFALISISIIFITTIDRFVPQRIFPILGNGFFNTFVLGLSNISAFGGILYLYFLPPLLKDPSNLKKVSIISTTITSIYLILTILSILFVFAFFMQVHEISPLYNATRYIEFGAFFQRFESIFLLIWIILFSCYLSIMLKFATYILQKITFINDTSPLIPVLGLLIFGIALLPKNLAISLYYETQIYPYLMIFLNVILSPGILIFANLLKIRKEKFNNKNVEIFY